MKTKAPVAPKPKLDPLKVKFIIAPSKKGELPTLLVEGDYPSRFNEAAAIKKKAEELMDDMRPIMLPDAMAELYRHNEDRPWDPISSVKLKDGSESVTRITFINRYSGTSPVIAEALFGGIKKKDGTVPDINNYLARTIRATFDSTVFLGPDGKFDAKRYEKFSSAIAAVAQSLGVPNPLSSMETVLPLPDFHSRRWLDFDASTNVKITEVLPNQINFVPCPKAAEVPVS